MSEETKFEHEGNSYVAKVCIGGGGGFIGEK